LQALRALSNKHSSLMRKLVNYGQKSFKTLATIENENNSTIG
jgi:hypothetical protein